MVLEAAEPVWVHCTGEWMDGMKDAYSPCVLYSTVLPWGGCIPVHGGR